MPVNQFVKNSPRLEKLLLAGAVHQLDAAKQQRVALEGRQRLGQNMLDLSVEDGQMHCLGDAIRQFAFRPQQIADFAVQSVGPDHLVVARFGEFGTHHDLAGIRNIRAAEDIGGAEMCRHLSDIARAAAENGGRQT